MNLLVLIWGWIVFTPILAPLFALPVLFVLGKVLRFALRRVNIAIIFILMSLTLAAVTYGNAQYGLKYYFEFLGQRGTETTGTVMSVLKESNLFGNESRIIVGVQFKNSFGEQKNISVSLSEPRLYPYGSKLNLVPEIGDEMRVRYFPKVETGLIINTDPRLSPFGAKVQCLQLDVDLKIALIRYGADTPPLQEAKQGYKDAIKRLLETNCLSLNDRNHYRGILSGLE